MTESSRLSFLTLAILSSLAACGGGGGGGGVEVAAASSPGGGGIGGTGVTSSGTIDGFGSIFVNGIEFETGAAEILVDGERSGEAALRLGMVVVVDGTLNGDGTTGSAERVVFDDEVQGPVEALQLSQDGDSVLLTVLGTGVIAERTGTVFDGVNFDSLAVGDVVEVSGFADGGGRLRATRIEKKDDFVEGVSEVERKGVINDLSGTSFLLGEFTVDFSGADLSGVPGGTLADGMRVEVKGTLENGFIVAARIDLEDDSTDRFATAEDLSVQGTVSGFIDGGEFLVNGVPVDAGNADLQPSDLVLVNGVIIEVEGTWDGTVLRARKVEARRGRVEIEAAVSSVDTGLRTLTLQLSGGTVTVRLDSRTQLDDDTDIVDPLTLADIAPGDFAEVEAILVDGNLVASRVDRDDADDDIVQAPVESFVSGTSITLLGITFAVADAQFEDQNDKTLTLEEFFSQLQVGMLVKVKDRRSADGIADEVEFEFERGLDGDLEFGGGNDPGDDDHFGSDDCDAEHGVLDDCIGYESGDEDCSGDNTGAVDDCGSGEADDSESDESTSDDDGEDDTGSDDESVEQPGPEDDSAEGPDSDDSVDDGGASGTEEDASGDSSEDDGLDDASHDELEEETPVESSS